MAVSYKVFGSFAKSVGDSLFSDINGSTDLKVMLTTVAPNQNTWAVFGDVTGEIVDASYTAGGVALANVTVTEAALVVSIDADDVVFTGLNKNFRYAVYYQDTLTKPLIGYMDNGSTVDVESAGPQDVTIQHPAGGFATHTVA